MCGSNSYKPGGRGTSRRWVSKNGAPVGQGPFSVLEARTSAKRDFVREFCCRLEKSASMRHRRRCLFAHRLLVRETGQREWLENLRHFPGRDHFRRAITRDRPCLESI